MKVFAALRVLGVATLLLLMSLTPTRAETAPSGEGGIAGENPRTTPEHKFRSPIRGTHYWGRAWPINFWNSMRLSDIDADFSRLRSDGFDTIILVLPWGEFQPRIEPCCEDNEQAWAHLGLLADKAGQHGLRILARVSFPWSSMPDQQWPGLERMEKMFLDDEVFSRFIDFARKIQGTLGTRQNFGFPFITWEDFYLSRVFEKPSGELLGTALEQEYRRFLKKHYTLKALRTIFRSSRINSYNSVPLPLPHAAYPDDQGFRLFHHFWDALLIERFFKPLQRVMPRLSMEVRIDAEPLPLTGGGAAWIDHGRTYRLPGADIVTAYYRSSWRMPNNGDLATADEALGKFDQLLAELDKHVPRRKVFFDQLLFNDNTPGFEKTTRLMPDQINRFLKDLGKPLAGTGGYALWHTRDYLANHFHNAAFLKGLTGWQTEGEAELVSLASGDHDLVLRGTGRLSQKLNPGLVPRSKSPGRFCADILDVSPDFVGTFMSGKREYPLTIAGPGRYCRRVEFASGSKIILAVHQGSVRLESVYLFDHDHQQGVYLANGTEGPYAKGIRRLNHEISRLAGALPTPGARAPKRPAP